MMTPTKRAGSSDGVDPAWLPNLSLLRAHIISTDAKLRNDHESKHVQQQHADATNGVDSSATDGGGSATDGGHGSATDAGARLSVAEHRRLVEQIATLQEEVDESKLLVASYKRREGELSAKANEVDDLKVRLVRAEQALAVTKHTLTEVTVRENDAQQKLSLQCDKYNKDVFELKTKFQAQKKKAYNLDRCLERLKKANKPAELKAKYKALFKEKAKSVVAKTLEDLKRVARERDAFKQRFEAEHQRAEKLAQELQHARELANSASFTVPESPTASSRAEEAGSPAISDDGEDSDIQLDLPDTSSLFSMASTGASLSTSLVHRTNEGAVISTGDKASHAAGAGESKRPGHSMKDLMRTQPLKPEHMDDFDSSTLLPPLSDAERLSQDDLDIPGSLPLAIKSTSESAESRVNPSVDSRGRTHTAISSSAPASSKSQEQAPVEQPAPSSSSKSRGGRKPHVPPASSSSSSPEERKSGESSVASSSSSKSQGRTSTEPLHEELLRQLSSPMLSGSGVGGGGGGSGDGRSGGGGSGGGSSSALEAELEDALPPTQEVHVFTRNKAPHSPSSTSNRKKGSRSRSSDASKTAPQPSRQISPSPDSSSSSTPHSTKGTDTPRPKPSSRASTRQPIADASISSSHSPQRHPSSSQPSSSSSSSSYSQTSRPASRHAKPRGTSAATGVALRRGSHAPTAAGGAASSKPPPRARPIWNPPPYRPPSVSRSTSSERGARKRSRSRSSAQEEVRGGGESAPNAAKRLKTTPSLPQAPPRWKPHPQFSRQGRARQSAAKQTASGDLVERVSKLFRRACDLDHSVSRDLVSVAGSVASYSSAQRLELEKRFATSIASQMLSPSTLSNDAVLAAVRFVHNFSGLLEAHHKTSGAAARSSATPLPVRLLDRVLRHLGSRLVDPDIQDQSMLNACRFYTLSCIRTRRLGRIRNVICRAMLAARGCVKMSLLTTVAQLCRQVFSLPTPGDIVGEALRAVLVQQLAELRSRCEALAEKEGGAMSDDDDAGGEDNPELKKLQAQLKEYTAFLKLLKITTTPAALNGLPKRRILLRAQIVTALSGRKTKKQQKAEREYSIDADGEDGKAPEQDSGVFDGSGDRVLALELLSLLDDWPFVYNTLIREHLMPNLGEVLASCLRTYSSPMSVNSDDRRTLRLQQRASGELLLAITRVALLGARHHIQGGESTKSKAIGLVRGNLAQIFEALSRIRDVHPDKKAFHSQATAAAASAVLSLRPTDDERKEVAAWWSEQTSVAKSCVHPEHIREQFDSLAS